MALAKLAVLFAFLNLEDLKILIGGSIIVNISSYYQYFLGPETWDTLELYWDLYVLTLLLGLLGLVMVLRRPRR